LTVGFLGTRWPTIFNHSWNHIDLVLQLSWVLDTLRESAKCQRLRKV
jgi:hypothetical protein